MSSFTKCELSLQRTRSQILQNTEATAFYRAFPIAQHCRPDLLSSSRLTADKLLKQSTQIAYKMSTRPATLHLTRHNDDQTDGRRGLAEVLCLMCSVQWIRENQKKNTSKYHYHNIKFTRPCKCDALKPHIVVKWGHTLFFSHFCAENRLRVNV